MASSVKIDAATTSGGALAAALSGVRDPGGPARAALIGELIERLGEAGDETLGTWLVEFAGPNAERRATMADVIGIAARRLAPDDEPPAEGAAAAAWRALVVAADRLHGGGVRALGRLPFVGDDRLALLVAEARAQMPEHSGGARRTVGNAGDALAALAVSRELREAVSAALGFAVVPTYDAVYEYDPPGSRVRTHVDARDFEIVVHLLLEQASTRGDGGESVLVAHRPGAESPERLRLRPGESVVLRGRGTLHCWEPLGPDERRSLTAIGFQTAE